MYVGVKLLDWLDIKDLWFGKTISLMHVKGVSNVKYRNKSYGYNKARYVKIEVMKETKSPE